MEGVIQSHRVTSESSGIRNKSSGLYSFLRVIPRRLNFICLRLLVRPRRRWVDNIRTGLQEVGCGYRDWIELAQDRDRWRTLVSAVMSLGVP